MVLHGKVLVRLTDQPCHRMIFLYKGISSIMTLVYPRNLGKDISSYRVFCIKCNESINRTLRIHSLHEESAVSWTCTCLMSPQWAVEQNGVRYWKTEPEGCYAFDHLNDFRDYLPPACYNDPRSHYSTLSSTRQVWRVHCTLSLSSTPISFGTSYTIPSTSSPAPTVDTRTRVFSFLHLTQTLHTDAVPSKFISCDPLVLSYGSIFRAWDIQRYLSPCARSVVSVLKWRCQGDVFSTEETHSFAFFSPPFSPGRYRYFPQHHIPAGSFHGLVVASDSVDEGIFQVHRASSLFYANKQVIHGSPMKTHFAFIVYIPYPFRGE